MRPDGARPLQAATGSKLFIIYWLQKQESAAMCPESNVYPSRFFSAIAAAKKGEYDSTVREGHFVVLFRHCSRENRQSVWGCVGKVRASHLSSVVLSF